MSVIKRDLVEIIFNKKAVRNFPVKVMKFYQFVIKPSMMTHLGTFKMNESTLKFCSEKSF